MLRWYEAILSDFTLRSGILLDCYSLMAYLLCYSIAKKIDTVPLPEPNCETNEGLSCLDSY